MEKLIRQVFKKGKPRCRRKSTEPYDSKFKAKLISEYLKGNKSYAMLGREYDLHPGIISRWIRVIKRGRTVVSNKGKISKFTGMSKKLTKSREELLAENELLKKQLEEEQLKVEIYKKVIEIAERDYKLDIVKKYGARRPTKSGK
jgi:transposase-like protein